MPLTNHESPYRRAARDAAGVPSPQVAIRRAPSVGSCARLGATLVCLAASVVAPHSLTAQPSPPRARLTEDLRLDASTEDFPVIGRIYVGPHGKIAVPIGQDMQIRLYDSTGKRTAVIGRKGGGPGEFTGIHKVGWIGDTMWVNDGNQRRFTFIGPNNKVLRATPHQTVRGVAVTVGTTATPATLNAFNSTGIRPDGLVFGSGYVMVPGVVSGNRLGDPAFFQLSAAGTPRFMMMLPKADVSKQGSYDERFWMSAAGFAIPIPFVTTPQTSISATSDRFGSLVSLSNGRDGGTLSVTLIRTTGEVLFTKRFPYRNVRIPAQARDSAVDAIMKGEKQTEGPPDLRQQFQAIAKRKMPTQYAGAESILLGLDNTVWIGLHASPEGQPTLVLNAKGEPVAIVLIPRGSRLRQANAKQIWMTEADSDGLTSVVRYRVAGIPVQTTGH